MFYTDEGLENKTARYIGVTLLIPTSFQPFFYCTQEFSDWWTSYYTNEIFDVSDIVEHQTRAFAFT